MKAERVRKKERDMERERKRDVINIPVTKTMIMTGKPFTSPMCEIGSCRWNRMDRSIRVDGTEWTDRFV